MRRLVYLVACSVDSFIAREDGSLDFALAHGDHLTDLVRRFPETIPGHLRGALNVTASNQSFDTVLMGRATYEVGLDLGVTSPYPHLKQLVFSRSLDRSPDPQVELVREEPAARVRALKGEPGRDIWLCGGAQLAGALLSEVDELVLKVNPVLLGAGIPLVSGAVQDTALGLLESHSYSNGVRLVRYRVLRSPEA